MGFPHQPRRPRKVELATLAKLLFSPSDGACIFRFQSEAELLPHGFGDIGDVGRFRHLQPRDSTLPESLIL